MQKRHLVGLVVFMASIASYDWLQQAVLDATRDGIAIASAPAISGSAGAPLMITTTATDIAELMGSLPDAMMLLATGVALMGLAAGVRSRADYD